VLSARSQEANGFPLVIIIADGWTRELFHEALHDALLPEIQGELLEPGILFPTVISVFPSVSIASHTTLLTGLNQCDHGIPGHRWLFRDKGSSRDYIGPHVRAVNADIYRNVQTVFERHHPRSSFAVQSIVNRGATGVIDLLTMNSEKILARTAELARTHPDSVIVSWLPKGDVLSHIYGPRSKALIAEMRSTSRGVRRLTESLRRSGLLSRARILFTSDHGQKPVAKRFVLTEFFRRLGYSSLQNRAAGVGADVSVFSSGDSSTYIYFDGRHFTKEARFHILADLAKREGIGLIFCRADARSHFILANQGIAKLSLASPTEIEYGVVTGDDPLDLLNGGRAARFTGDVLDDSVQQQRYPDLLHQYLDSYVPARSADVLVTSAPTYHFGMAPRLAWRFGYHRGSHGGPSREEMLFSAIGFGSTATIDNSPLRSKDLLRRFESAP